MVDPIGFLLLLVDQVGPIRDTIESTLVVNGIEK